MTLNTNENSYKSLGSSMIKPKRYLIKVNWERFILVVKERWDGVKQRELEKKGEDWEKDRGKGSRKRDSYEPFQPNLKEVETPVLPHTLRYRSQGNVELEEEVFSLGDGS